jgi:hypothetical protein
MAPWRLTIALRRLIMAPQRLTMLWRLAIALWRLTKAPRRLQHC